MSRTVTNWSVLPDFRRAVGNASCGGFFPHDPGDQSQKRLGTILQRRDAELPQPHGILRKAGYDTCASLFPHRVGPAAGSPTSRYSARTVRVLPTCRRPRPRAQREKHPAGRQGGPPFSAPPRSSTSWSGGAISSSLSSPCSITRLVTVGRWEMYGIGVSLRSANHSVLTAKSMAALSREGITKAERNSRKG
jgi:hypothetical protein